MKKKPNLQNPIAQGLIDRCDPHPLIAAFKTQAEAIELMHIKPLH
jgi:hypothetical protein